MRFWQALKYSKGLGFEVGGEGGGTDSPCSHSPSPSPMEKAEAVLRQNIDPS